VGQRHALLSNAVIKDHVWDIVDLATLQRDMVYIKGFIAGFVALILAALFFEVILLTLGLIPLPHGLYYDARMIVPHFWFVSLPVAIVAFARGFFWGLGRASKFR
jgi:hypothetical protein